MGPKTKTFFTGLISERDPKSARRFVTLLTSFLFIITCLTVLILLICLFISITKLQGINIEALRIITELIKEIIKYEAFITIGGLCFVTVPDFAKIAISWFSTKEPTPLPDPTQNNPEQPVEQIK